ncbi:regulatory protein RecX [Niabella aquatica]
MNHSDQQLTKEQALQKMRQYCAYSERCHNDVVSKLYNLGVWKKDHDEIIATLIEENYLNEERFAKAFTGGHFRTKHWGRNKIIAALKQKAISAYCIKKGMQEIDEADYNAALEKLFHDKWQSLKGTQNRFARMKKTSDFLLQKGYEAHLINPLFNKV